MSEIKLKTKTAPHVQLVIPSVKDIIFSYVRAYGYEPVSDEAIWFEGDSATVTVRLDKASQDKASQDKASQEKPQSQLTEGSLSINLDTV